MSVDNVQMQALVIVCERVPGHRTGYREGAVLLQGATAA